MQETILCKVRLSPCNAWPDWTLNIEKPRKLKNWSLKIYEIFYSFPKISVIGGIKLHLVYWDEIQPTIDEILSRKVRLRDHSRGFRK